MDVVDKRIEPHSNITRVANKLSFTPPWQVTVSVQLYLYLQYQLTSYLGYVKVFLIG